jgi:Mrp family chromosome partitioning ATPase
MTTGEPRHLRDYVMMLRRQALPVAAGVLAGGVLGFAAMGLVPVSYAATTSVIVRPTLGDTNVENGRTSTAINLDTEAQVVTSSVVARIAATSLGAGESIRALRKHVSVTVPANTSVLDISFRAGTPAAAVRGSKAFAAAYLQNRTALATDRLHQQAASLEQRIRELNANLRTTTVQLGDAAPGGTHHVLLATQRDLIVSQIQASTSELDPLYTQEVDPGAVLSDAQTPRRPSGWNPVLVLVSGLFLGAAAGLCGAVARDRADVRVRTGSDLARLGVNVLVPTFGLAPDDDVRRRDRHSPEAMRQLRNVLLAVLPRHGGTLTVAATSPGDAGAATAASLAMTFARSGIETILVSANTHSDGVADLFDIDEGVGLSDVLRSGLSVLDAIHPVAQLDRLAVVPPGADGLLMSEQLEGHAFEPVIRDLEQLAEVVVLDVAPTSVNADAQTVVTATNGLLLVTTAGVTLVQEVDDALAQLTHVGANNLGAVVVAQPRHHLLFGRRRRPRPATAGPGSGARGGPVDSPAEGPQEGPADTGTRRLRAVDGAPDDAADYQDAAATM